MIARTSQVLSEIPSVAAACSAQGFHRVGEAKRGPGGRDIVGFCNHAGRMEIGPRLGHDELDLPTTQPDVNRARSQVTADLAGGLGQGFEDGQTSGRLESRTRRGAFFGCRT